MGEIASKVRTANDRVKRAVYEIMTQGVVINTLRGTCKHDWRFHSQANACHEHLWNVTYGCSECGLLSTEKTPPVCEKCLLPLVRAEKNDRQATREAKKKGPEKCLGNPPLAFRCPECKKIHILWHDGD